MLQAIVSFLQAADRVIDLCKFYLKLAHDALSDLRVILIETSTLKTVLDSFQFLASCGIAQLLWTFWLAMKGRSQDA